MVLFAISARAASMARVVRIAGPSTIVVIRDNVQSEVALTGIEITDPQNATGFLSWTLDSAWVAIEDGQVYRSPDAMLINAELVKKGYARPTGAAIPAVHTNAVYLGELDLGAREKARAPAKAPVRQAKAMPRQPPRPRIIHVRVAKAPAKASRR
ncbi:MAG TPA: hypothetical protein VLV78_16995 [Thermoanaerobaculia bacterium]|nr:hypothetical protein [Thermoanaerobaculia bacterium]